MNLIFMTYPQNIKICSKIKVQTKKLLAPFKFKQEVFNGKIKIDVKFENETVWLSQQQMVDLCDTTKQNISFHIKNIFDEEELVEKSTVKEFLTVQKEGNRKVERKVKYYNLDMIISLGYRIKSSY